MIRSLIAITLILSFTALAQNLKQQQLQQKKLQQLQQQISYFKQSLNKYQSNYKQEYRQLQDIEVKISEFANKIANTKKQVRDNQSKLNKAYKKLNKLSSNINNLEEKMLQDIVAAYKVGKQDKVKMLLLQDNSATLDRMFEYYKFILTARKHRLDEFVTTMQKIEVANAEIEETNIKREKLLLKFTIEREQLDKIYKTHSTKVKDLQSKIYNTKNQISEFAEISEQLEKLIVDIKSIDTDIDNQKFTNLRVARGKLEYPVKDSELSSIFGTIKIGNLKWNGIKFLAPRGKNVYPIFAGRVVLSSYMRGYGLIIIIDHGFDYISLYAQNQTLYAAEGDWVNTNQRIGSVGLTGGQKTPSLYFELRHKGKVLNPKPWF